ncbi:hypothetical protein GCM10029963_24380 [Micromonospora andamanensis]|uniref:phosphotransferase enzyme family protein n=1 Tax=Micromonospora andamanensis TaxID=1287068 RepID=UPI00194EDB14|nr:phosphotransferase [Micromonospora andamanensis]GIJ38328.1 hypothetical protein Vwe01_16530 [Micromonospora andamanensis]
MNRADLAATIDGGGVLNLHGGRTLRHLARMRSGRSSLVLSGVEPHGGRRLIVKIARSSAHRLATEAQTLSAISTCGVPVPRPVGLDTVTLGNRDAPCLVLTWCPGHRPQTLPAMIRFGTALARLSRHAACCPHLPKLSATEVLAQHHEAVDALAEALPASLRRRLRAVSVGPAPSGLLHGDPGPDNFLDTPDGGTLVDLERAAVGPLSLDLARAQAAFELAEPSPEPALLSALGMTYRRLVPLPARPSDGWWTIAATQLLRWRWDQRHRSDVPNWGLAADRIERRLAQEQAC